MNRLGIQSLNAGAPDLRLSGDQTQRGTYTQRRRNQMAYGGIAGLDGRKAYGIGSWFQKAKDKVVDDLIPNEIKENPAGAALVGGALLNQFGIPFTGQFTQSGDPFGQNWLGELLGRIPGTGGTIDMVLGGQEGPQYQTLGSGIKNLLTGGAGLPPQLGGSSTLQDAINYAKNAGLDYVGSKLNIPGSGSGTGTGQYPPVNWKGPLAIGTAIGAADYLTRSDDKMPEQLAIDPSRFATAEAAMADPNLRFKPQEQYTLKDGGRIGYADGGIKTVSMETGQENTLEELYQDFIAQGFSPREAAKKAKQAYDDMQIDMAQGGRIGYTEAGAVDPEYNGWKKIYEKNPGVAEMHDNHQQYLERYESEGKAQGGRIGAQEGGLMNLGGMEKDYRQEGGFVPIGGEEKADDVPARLSKNEFVFTADAVRSAGGGDIDAGAEVMENLMENLEAGGKVSEDSQGVEGAQEMFANTQRLQNRII